MYTPTAFNLQWHITEKCNLRCIHCYQKSYNQQELSYKQLLSILNQFKNALAAFRKNAKTKIPGHITLTGGEPLVRPDLYELLSIFAQDKKDYDFAILTNGTLIDAKTAYGIKKYNPRYVQVSIEGTRETHDAIRGAGMYDKAVQGLQHLIEQNISTLISFTAHRRNYAEFPAVAQIGRELGGSRVWSDRLIPTGSGDAMKELMLTPEENKAYFQMMKEEQLKRSSDYFPKTEVAMHRALQFLCGGHPYSCTAGKNLLTVDTNGDVYPCRRMPIKLGNVLEESLLEIYTNSPMLKSLREEESSCSPCVYYKRCQGGLRCLSYAVAGNPLEKDPGCWIKC